MEKLCLDSNVLIQILRDDAEIMARLEEMRKGHVFVTTTYNSFELYCGAFLKKAVRENERIESMLSKMEVFELNKNASKLAAKISAEQISRGRQSSPGDAIIAGICLENNCKLFTLNKKHFEKIPGLELA